MKTNGKGGECVCIQIVGGETLGKEGRPSWRWEGNIKIDFEELGYRAWHGIMCFRKCTGSWIL